MTVIYLDVLYRGSLPFKEKCVVMQNVILIHWFAVEIQLVQSKCPK